MLYMYNFNQPLKYYWSLFSFSLINTISVSEVCFQLIWPLRKHLVDLMNVIGSLAKTIENLFFSENFKIGQSSFKCPGLSVHSVISASL